jgi:hypothetical protein
LGATRMSWDYYERGESWKKMRPRRYFTELPCGNVFAI